MIPSKQSCLNFCPKRITLRSGKKHMFLYPMALAMVVVLKYQTKNFYWLEDLARATPLDIVVDFDDKLRI